MAGYRRKRTFRKPRVKRRRFNITGATGMTRRGNPYMASRLGGVTLRQKRMVYAGVLAPSGSLSTGTSYFWQYQTVSLDKGIKNFDATSTTLTGLSNKSEYQALFDQYKLGAYKITLRPRMQDINAAQFITTGGTGTTGAHPPPRFCICIDGKSTLTPSGTYSPSTLNTLLENGGKIYRADKPVNIYVKSWITEQYGGGANRYVRAKYTDLNNVAGTDMAHRGFHMFLFREGFDSSNTQLEWDVFITYYLTFKNAK